MCWCCYSLSCFQTIFPISFLYSAGLLALSSSIGLLPVLCVFEAKKSSNKPVVVALREASVLCCMSKLLVASFTMPWASLTRVAQVFIKRLHFLLEVLNPFSTIWKYVIQGQLKCVPLALAATERSNWTI